MKPEEVLAYCLFRCHGSEKLGSVCTQYTFTTASMKWACTRKANSRGIEIVGMIVTVIKTLQACIDGEIQRLEHAVNGSRPAHRSNHQLYCLLDASGAWRLTPLASNSSACRSWCRKSRCGRTSPSTTSSSPLPAPAISDKPSVDK